MGVKTRRRLASAPKYANFSLMSKIEPKKFAEAKYIAAATCCTLVLWMKQTLQDIKVEYDQPTSIIHDNTSAINILNNHVMHSKKKHIPIKYHFLI